MTKTAKAAGDSVVAGPRKALLRAIPSVETILSGPRLSPIIERYGRAMVKEHISLYLSRFREAVSGSSEGREFDTHVCADAIEASLAAAQAPALRRVINGSGVIIHTNLGRSPLDRSVWKAAGASVCGYSNLEFDLETGERGSRDELLSSVARQLFGCEAAILTNNNAAGTLLLLASVAAKREVIVSRGELVEIGGSFRVPDVIQQGGAKLREVGTTNRTRAADYADAVTRRTAAILRVHRSNFDIVGFTETPTVDALVEVSRSKHIPMLYDEGSGRVVDLSRYGFAADDTIRQLFERGVDVVTCSTDKLIGSTQGGLILGSAAIIDRCRRHPLMRALRAGKESYALIAETLRIFASGKHEEQIPIYRMLATPLDDLRRRGESIAGDTAARLVESRSVLGGGTTPTETIASISIELPGKADAVADRLLRANPPIVGRISNDRFAIDLRTVLPEEDADVRGQLTMDSGQ
jgi:L-seryl-tRNA(Ser) seleniumtransferase